MEKIPDNLKMKNLVSSLADTSQKVGGKVKKYSISNKKKQYNLQIFNCTMLKKIVQK